MAKNVLAICVLLWAPMALANQVTQVSAKDGNVRITADEPPNFTTFTIDYPPRLVVDLAGATLVDVPTNIPVGQNGVQGIQTLPYGTGTSAVARIIIMYEKPVQTDILTDGNSIVVRQAETPAPATAPATAPAPVLAKAQAAPPPPSPTPAAPGPPPVEQAAAAPPSPTPPPEPAAPQRAAPPPPSPRPAASEPVVATAPPAQPPRNPDNAAPEAPAQPAPQPAAVVAEREPAAPAPQAAPATPTYPASEEQAAPPPAPTPSAAPPPATAPPPAPALAAAEPPPLKLNTEAQLASPPPPAATEEPPHVSARRKTLSLVGLRFNNGATSVFVRTNEPVSYRVSQRPNGLVVTIENTSIRRRNDSRPLDAQFFDSPVAKVQASQNRGDVEVTIDLKTQAAYQATQNGREVELNFSQKG